MANGHVEIPNSNHNNLRNSTGTKSTSDTSNMDDTVEFRILMAYATRRRPKRDEQDSPVIVNSNVNETDRTEQKETNKKKKKKGWRRVLSILKCVKPRTEDEERQQTPKNHRFDVDDRCGDFIHFKEGEC